MGTVGSDGYESDQYCSICHEHCEFTYSRVKRNGCVVANLCYNIIRELMLYLFFDDVFDVRERFNPLLANGKKTNRNTDNIWNAKFNDWRARLTEVVNRRNSDGLCDTEMAWNEEFELNLDELQNFVLKQKKAERYTGIKLTTEFEEQIDGLRNLVKRKHKRIRFNVSLLDEEFEECIEDLKSLIQHLSKCDTYITKEAQFADRSRYVTENDGQNNRTREASTGSFIKYYVLLLFSVTGCVQGNSDLKVNIMRKPVMFGGLAQLECIAKLNSEPSFMAWTKIPAGETIARGSSPLPSSKYKVNTSLENGIVRYRLTIKDFSVLDIDREYKCYMDFLSNSITLQLNEKEFVAIPKELKVKKNCEIRNGMLTGQLSLISVYPQPTCEAFFEKDSITDQLHVVNTKDPVLFTTDIHIQKFTEVCIGNLFVNCTVGATQHLVHPYQGYVNSCPENLDVDSIKIIVPVGCLGIMIIAIVLAAVLWTKTRQIRGTRTKELRKNIAQMDAHNGTKQWRKEVVTTEAQDDCENTPMNC